jgi:hypothetical protein
MLNEFSDRVPEGVSKPFLLRGATWLSIVSIVIIAAIGLGFLV